MLLIAPAVLLAAVDPRGRVAGEAPAASGPSAPLSETNVQVPEAHFAAPTQRGKIGHIWAPVLLNRKGPFSLALDTGSTNTAVTAQVADELRIPIRTVDSVVVHGATGAATLPTIWVESVTVGDMELRTQQLPIISSPGGADGVLGVEGLFDKRIVVDFRNDAVTISKSQSERAPPDFVTIPFRVIGKALPIVDARVGNIRTRAIIVTGAAGTLGDAALYEALLRDHLDAAVSTQAVTGVTGAVQNGKAIGVPPIRLGDLTLQGVRITTGDTYLFQYLKMTREPSMMVGMDVLGSFDTLIIDYRRKELQVRLRPDEHASRRRGQEVFERMAADPAEEGKQLVIPNLGQLRQHVKQHGAAKPDTVRRGGRGRSLATVEPTPASSPCSNS